MIAPGLREVVAWPDAVTAEPRKRQRQAATLRDRRGCLREGVRPGTPMADPRSLLSRQGPGEMTTSRVQDMAEDMMLDQLNWGVARPVRVVERNGVRIIEDGHHRTAAAIEARIQRVPVEVVEGSDAQWSEFMLQVIETGER